MRETLTLMIWIYSLEEVTYKYEKGTEDFIMPNKPYTATTKRKKKKWIQEEESKSWSRGPQFDPIRNLKLTKEFIQKQKRYKVANGFLHLYNLGSELTFNICWNAPIIKLFMAFINTKAQIRVTHRDSLKFTQGAPSNMRGVTEDISGHVRRTNGCASPESSELLPCLNSP